MSELIKRHKMSLRLQRTYWEMMIAQAYEVKDANWQDCVLMLVGGGEI